MGKQHDAPGGYTAPGQGNPNAYQQAAGADIGAMRPNQNTGFASSQWTQGPDGSWSQNVGLNGGLGQAFQSLSGQAANDARSPFDNGSDARNQAINGAYSQATSRLDPRFAQEQEQLQTQLANQGLAPGSQAYQTAMENFGREKNDAYTSAMNGAIGQGTAAQQATFGENMASRMAPYQMLASLRSFEQMPGVQGNPQFLNAAQGADQYGFDAHKFNNQQTTDAINGASQLVKSFLPFGF